LDIKVNIILLGLETKLKNIMLIKVHNVVRNRKFDYIKNETQKTSCAKK
jgi:hypothetical protein